MAAFLRSDTQKIEILMWHECGPSDSFMEFWSEFFAHNFLSDLARYPLNMMTLRMVFASLSPAGNISGLTDHEIIQYLASQITRGHIRLVPRAYTFPIGGGGAAPEAEEQEEEAPAVREEEEKSWIEIQLVDEAGQPVARERYRISYPDGVVVSQGVTDAQGLARVDDLDPGTYQVTFTDLDGHTWEKI